MPRLPAALAVGLLAAAWLGAGCSKPPPPPPPQPRPVQPLPPPQPETPPFTVTTLNLGKAIYVDQNVTAAQDSFGRKDTVFLSVVSAGVAQAVALRARWYGPEGTLLQEGVQNIASVGPKATAFHLDNKSGLQVGKYSVEVFVDDRPAGSKQFEVLKNPPDAGK